MFFQIVIVAFVCSTADAALTVAETDTKELPNECVWVNTWGTERQRMQVIDMFAFVHKDDGRVIAAAKVYSKLDNKYYYSAGETKLEIW